MPARLERSARESSAMIRTTPFHPRTSELNETGLWEHWSGHLAATKYQVAEKFEYFAIRNSAGLFDTSPLFKYRFHGPDAERYLAGVLTRDPRSCRPGHAQYTLWCDDRGFVIEDGVLLRHADDDFTLTSAEPNLGYFRDLIGRLRVSVDEISDDYAVLAMQGPKSKEILAALAEPVGALGYFELTSAGIAGKAVTISRTGYTGDLGYEVWVPTPDALEVWDAIADASRGRGVIPFGMTALYMARIEAGLVLLDVDFASSRFAWTDEDRTTPLELGYGWMVRGLDGDDRAFIGRAAIKREIRDRTSRWHLTGLVVDWRDYDRIYDEAGLIPPKDHTPVQDELFVYDAEMNQVGYATSFMFSPVLQRHIALARVRPELAVSGSSVRLEIDVNHRYEYVVARTARLPHFEPARKTA
ncbi:MAG: aminomethyltransferase family protein [Chloroflexota bacterium]